MAEINWNIGLTPDYSRAIQFQEAGQTNRAQQAAAEREQAKQAALSAYATDPKAGLAGVIATDPRTGIALQDQQLQNDQAQRTAQVSEQERALKAKQAFAEAIVHVPPERRAGVYDAIGSIMPGVDAQTLESLRGHIQDNDFWRALSGKFSEELKVVAPGGAAINNEGKVLYQAPSAEPKAPAGYRPAANGALEAIPGGPADPRVAGSLAGARRKPGGGGASRGMKLPAGFILD